MWTYFAVGFGCTFGAAVASGIIAVIWMSSEYIRDTWAFQSVPSEPTPIQGESGMTGDKKNMLNSAFDEAGGMCPEFAEGFMG